MPFTLPQFNCLFNAWRFDPVTFLWSKVSDHDVCQWYVNPRQQDFFALPLGDEEIMLHHLRVPKGTDIREGDLVEVEPGSEWFYSLVETERMHLNFPNEYFVGFANIVDAESTPFLIATENGFLLETEGGSHMYTEIY